MFRANLLYLPKNILPATGAALARTKTHLIYMHSGIYQMPTACIRYLQDQTRAQASLVTSVSNSVEYFPVNSVQKFPLDGVCPCGWFSRKVRAAETERYSASI